MKATNVRLRLLGAKTLFGEYLPLATGDPTVTRRVSIALNLCICALISLTLDECPCQNNCNRRVKVLRVSSMT